MHPLLLLLRKENNNIVNDHRAVKHGDAIFITEKNLKFAKLAIENGCNFLITSKNFGGQINNHLEAQRLPVISYTEITEVSLPTHPSIIETDIEPATLLQEFYTPKPQNCIGITGTNGKTSTTNFVSDILSALYKPNLCIGTLGFKINNQELDNYITLTTPSIYDLHHFLYKAKNDYAADYAVMEVSSHGLHQARVEGINFNVGCFTNLTQDHLDYHETMENYFESKTYLFTKYVKPNGYAVLNADIEQFACLKDICDKRKINVIDYGYNANYIKLSKVESSEGKQNITVLHKGQEYNFTLNIIGHFQLLNMLCAIGAVIASGFEIQQILPIIPSLSSPPGRLQKCDTESGIHCYIDYAHTPDALERAIKAVKAAHPDRRTILVFGCGGNRDKTKRPLMGKVGAQNATIVIVTDDNPRLEEPEQIRSDIIAGIRQLRADQMKEMKKSGKLALLHLLQNEQVLGNLIEECEGRESAIAHAVELAEVGDAILIAGKGHENYQLIGDKKTYFSDLEIAMKYLASKS